MDKWNIKKNFFKWYITINKLPLKIYELQYCEIVRELGNVMPYCRIKIKTNREAVIENLLYEMSKVEIGLANLYNDNQEAFKLKFKFFLANVKRKRITSGFYEFELLCISDAWKFLGYTDLIAASKRDISANFLSQLQTTQGGPGMIKVVVKDNIKSRLKDFQYWIAYDQTGIETFNEILQRNILLHASNNPDGKREYTYVSVLDFNEKSGEPVAYFYDLKLRTRNFSPPIREVIEYNNQYMRIVKKKQYNFSFRKADNYIPYTDIHLDIKGADYSQLYWQRTAQIYAMEENVFKQRRIKQPKLFSDSVDYDHQQDFDGRNAKNLPNKFTIFHNTSPFMIEWYNSNHHSINYITQKYQSIADLLALKKISVTLTFHKQFLKFNPIDIIKVEIKAPETANQGNETKIDKRLSTKYCVYKVIYQFTPEMFNTIITAGRDSFSQNKNSTFDETK